MGNRNETLKRNYHRLRKAGFISQEINKIKFRKQETIDSIIEWAETYKPAFEKFEQEKEKIVNDKDYIPSKEE